MISSSSSIFPRGVFPSHSITHNHPLPLSLIDHFINVSIPSPSLRSPHSLHNYHSHLSAFTFPSSSRSFASFPSPTPSLSSPSPLPSPRTNSFYSSDPSSSLPLNPTFSDFLNLSNTNSTDPSSFSSHDSVPQLSDPSAPSPPPLSSPPVVSRLPPWLKAIPADSEKYRTLRTSVRSLGLSTVCEEAKCPNIGECWGGGTATIMIMGDTCTRGCRFCAIKTSKSPSPLDPNEPTNVSNAIGQWGISYVVITSVNRDDLSDGGAEHFARTVREIKTRKPTMLIETLCPDFFGQSELSSLVISEGVNVFSHNVETVEALTPFVRDRRATYRRSLSVLQKAKENFPSVYTKSSIMVGCGEKESEVIQTLKDLREIHCDIVTFGQYLRPTKRHMKVVEFIHPEQFTKYGQIAKEMGFLGVQSGPLVRSSYKANELYEEMKIEETKRKNENKL